jgi:hypothetical protein
LKVVKDAKLDPRKVPRRVNVVPASKLVANAVPAVKLPLLLSLLSLRNVLARAPRKLLARAPRKLLARAPRKVLARAPRNLLASKYLTI